MSSAKTGYYKLETVFMKYSPEYNSGEEKMINGSLKIRSAQAGFSLIEMLFAMVILMFGLLVLFVAYPITMRVIDRMEEQSLASIVANNYEVALKHYAVKNGFHALRDGVKVGMQDLEGGLQGNKAGEIELVDVKLRNLGDIHDVPIEKDFYSQEYENSNGNLLVRILFNNVKAEQETYSKFFRITVKSRQSGKAYEFYPSIGK